MAPAYLYLHDVTARFFFPSPDVFEAVKAGDNGIPLEAEVQFQQVGGRTLHRFNHQAVRRRCGVFTCKMFSR